MHHHDIEFLHLEEYLSGSTAPLITALIMGLLVVINPCQLAANFSGTLYLARQGYTSRKFWKDVSLLALGRLVTYLVLGGGTVLILSLGIETLQLQQKVFALGEHIFGVFVLLLGILFLLEQWVHLPHLHEGKVCMSPHAHHHTEPKKQNAFVTGLLLALAFCPVTAMIFFAVMVPLAIAQTAGWWYFLVFAITTALPVFVFAALLSWGMKGLEKKLGSLQNIRKWVGTAIGIVFILLGAYLSIVHFLLHHAH